MNKKSSGLIGIKEQLQKKITLSLNLLITMYRNTKVEQNVKKLEGEKTNSRKENEEMENKHKESILHGEKSSKYKRT